MGKRNPENFLFDYYTTETYSFLKHLKKVKTLLNKNNIHKLRVEIKRIHAIFHLLEMLSPKSFNGTDYYACFKNVFKNAGRIREIQVNNICLSQYKLPPSAVLEYSKFANDKKKKFKKKLKKAVKSFDIVLLNDSKKEIKKLCEKTTNKIITNRCLQYIKQEASKIKRISVAGNNTETMHKIRIHMKSLGAIAILLYKINADKELEKLLMHIKETEALIGDWHDKVILVSSLEYFFKKTGHIADGEFSILTTLSSKIKKENQQLLKKVTAKVNATLKQIHNL